MKKIGLLGVLACLFLPALAFADNTTCAGATTLVPDGSPVDQVFTAVSQSRWFQFAARADRSYAVMPVTTTPSDLGDVTFSPPQGDCVGGPLPAGMSFTNISLTEPVSFLNTPCCSGAGRWAITTGAGTGTVFFRMDVFGAAAPGLLYTIRLEDTTQINTFFSTFSGFNTFYRLANTSNQTLNVRLKMVNDAGATVKDITFTILPNRSAPTRNTTAGDLNIAPNTGGFTLFMHDGPPNALALDGFLMQGTIVLPIKIVDARQRR
jgi:hypothetical protein